MTEYDVYLDSSMLLACEHVSLLSKGLCSRWSSWTWTVCYCATGTEQTLRRRFCNQDCK